MRVFLDTNIIIRGPKHPEHHELKRKANRSQIALYTGIDVYSEQSKRSLDHYFGPYSELFDLYKSGSNADIISKINETRRRQREFEKAEKAELLYWDDCTLSLPECSFNALVSAGCVFTPEMMHIIDIKNEIHLLEELISFHNIHSGDAILLMTAHSAEMDYFLTWDKKLINRAIKVEWLKPVVSSPKKFLALHNKLPSHRK